MIGTEYEVIRRYVLDVGLWKFYIVCIGLLTVFILNILRKEKGKLEKIGIVSSGVLLLITIAFIILASLK